MGKECLESSRNNIEVYKNKAFHRPPFPAFITLTYLILKSEQILRKQAGNNLRKRAGKKPKIYFSLCMVGVYQPGSCR